MVVRDPSDAIRQGLALVPDDRKQKGLVMGASLRANIALASRRGRWFIGRAEEEQTAGRLAGELRIKAAGLDQPVDYLSGGNQQKAVLAKWLLRRGAGISVDEPTRGIDVRSKAEICDLVRALAAGGAAVVLASSEMEELLGLSDRMRGDAPRADRRGTGARRGHRGTHHAPGDRRLLTAPRQFDFRGSEIPSDPV